MAKSYVVTIGEGSYQRTIGLYGLASTNHLETADRFEDKTRAQKSADNINNAYGKKRYRCKVIEVELEPNRKY